MKHAIYVYKPDPDYFVFDNALVESDRLPIVGSSFEEYEPVAIVDVDLVMNGPFWQTADGKSAQGAFCDYLESA